MWDDTVKDQTNIVVMIAEINEIVHALGGNFGIQFTLDDAAVFHSQFKSRIHNQ